MSKQNLQAKAFLAVTFDKDSNQSDTDVVPLSAALAEIARHEQAGAELMLQVHQLSKLKGTDDHPEDFCHRCGGRNITWYADSDLWNKFDPPESIICPICFVIEAEAGGVKTSAWRVAPGDDEAGRLMLRLHQVEDAMHGKSANPDDPEDCEACLLIEDWPCPVHFEADVMRLISERDNALLRLHQAEGALREIKDEAIFVEQACGNNSVLQFVPWTAQKAAKALAALSRLEDVGKSNSIVVEMEERQKHSELSSGKDVD